MACEVYAFVDHPYEVVDTYGRMVGNVRVGKKFAVDVNTWLMQEGWVLPAFYTSMSDTEITTLLEAARMGKKMRRVWAGLTLETSKFNASLTYRKGGAVDEKKDRGLVLMPKLFRRQVAYEMEKTATVFSGTFTDFLRSRPEQCALTSEFLREGVHAAPMYYLHDFMKGKRFTKQPQDVVFREKFSSVVDEKGKRIDRF